MNIRKWLRDRIDRNPHASPGYWYVEYNQDWHNAHHMQHRTPQQVAATRMRTKGVAPGCFVLNNQRTHDVWSTSTPDWDEWWFRERGMRLPKRISVRAVTKTECSKEFNGRKCRNLAARGRDVCLRHL